MASASSGGEEGEITTQSGVASAKMTAFVAINGAKSGSICNQ